MKKFILAAVTAATVSGAMAATPNPDRTPGDMNDIVIHGNRLVTLNGNWLYYITQQGPDADVVLSPTVPSTEGFFRTAHTPAGQYGFIYTGSNGSAASGRAERLLNEARQAAEEPLNSGWFNDGTNEYEWTCEANWAGKAVVSWEGSVFTADTDYNPYQGSGTAALACSGEDDQGVVNYVNYREANDYFPGRIQAAVTSPPPAAIPTYTIHTASMYLSDVVRTSFTIDASINGEPGGYAGICFGLPLAAGAGQLRLIPDLRGRDECDFEDEVATHPVPFSWSNPQ